jgi:hypothetical protein
MKYVEIVGPCSKWIDGRGWVTQIPEELLFAKGYVNLLELMRENNKNSNVNLNTNEKLKNVIPQDEFKCKHLKCDMDGAHCSLGQTDCFDYCRLRRVPYCDKYEEKEDSNECRRRSKNKKR